VELKTTINKKHIIFDERNRLQILNLNSQVYSSKIIIMKSVQDL
jgi:hypothetical protein